MVRVELTVSEDRARFDSIGPELFYLISFAFLRSRKAKKIDGNARSCG